MCTLKKEKKLVIDFSNGKGIDGFKGDLNVIVVTASESDSPNVYSIKKAGDGNFELASEFTQLWTCLSENYKFHCQSSLSYVYRNVVRPLSLWVQVIDEVFDRYDIVEVAFNKFSNSKKVFVYEAEGEVNRKWLYSSEYYISGILAKYINNKHPRIKLIKDDVTSKTKVTMHYWIRSFTFVSVIFFMNLFRRILGLRFRNLKNNSSNAEVGVSTRSIVQSDFATKMIKKNEYEKVTIFASEQASCFILNNKYMKKQSIPFEVSSSCSIFLSAIVLLKTLFSIFRVYISDIKPILLLNRNLQLDSKSILIDYLFRSYDFEIYSLSLKEAVSGQMGIKKIVSFDMFTPHAFFLIKNIGIDVCQIQTTLIQPKVECDFIAGSRFYFTDKLSYENFLIYNEALKDKIFLIDALKYRELPGFNIIDKVLKQGVVYFSQPIEIKNELDVVSAIYNYCLANDIPFYIKPHPRQNKSDFEDYQTLDSQTKFENIARDYSLIVTRSSSIGMDCFYYGIPVLFARTIPSIRNAQISFIPEDYNGDVASISEMIEMIDNFDELKLSFSKYCKKNKKSSLNDDILTVLS